MLWYDCRTVIFWRTPVIIMLPLDGCWDTVIVDYINMYKNLLLNVSAFLTSRTGLGNGPLVKSGLLLVSVNKILFKRSHFHLYATCGFHTVKAKVYSKDTLWFFKKPELFYFQILQRELLAHHLQFSSRVSRTHASSLSQVPGLLEFSYVDDSIF